VSDGRAAENEDAFVGKSLHGKFAVFAVIYSERQWLVSLLFGSLLLPKPRVSAISTDRAAVLFRIISEISGPCRETGLRDVV
jgi:hypothetical protein